MSSYDQCLKFDLISDLELFIDWINQVRVFIY